MNKPTQIAWALAALIKRSAKFKGKFRLASNAGRGRPPWKDVIMDDLKSWKLPIVSGS